MQGQIVKLAEWNEAWCEIQADAEVPTAAVPQTASRGCFFKTSQSPAEFTASDETQIRSLRLISLLITDALCSVQLEF